MSPRPMPVPAAFAGLDALRILVPLLVSLAATPSMALGAFELRDASPVALGSVSMDREARGFFDEVPRRGFGFVASHASLHGVEGLASEQARASLDSGALGIDLAHAQTGAPGLREHATRLTLREGAARLVSLSARAERLVLTLEGEPRVEAWTLGAGARGHAPLGSVRLEVEVSADRVWRGGDAERLALAPAVPWSVGLRAQAARLEVADHWEGDGRTSPRLVLDVRAGRLLALRFGRGERPGRTGAAAAVRVRRLEVAVGRWDDEYGGSVSSLSLRLVPGIAESGGKR
ncbi:MAG TPA: hypothetical protein VFP58_06190 [Candidatus Eisenbacteria bacterium]|nr:hypothetical protein [Candidatus Eisenbacteria bacterium]